MSGRIHRVAIACLLAALALSLAEAQESAEPLLARAFEVRYKPLTDTADLVTPLLSTEGTMMLQPKLKTMVVEDRVAPGGDVVAEEANHLIDR